MIEGQRGMVEEMRTYRIEIRLIQLSVILSVLVVIGGFIGLWGERTPQQDITPPQQQEENHDSKNLKVVTLGDSFTFGYPGNTENSWPAVLQEELEELGVEVVNKGKGQQNSEDLYERFETDVIGEKPGRVVIFAGNGDALQGKNLEFFQKYIKAMVEKAQSNHIEPILALPMPYKGTQTLIEEFREWEVNYAMENKLTVLDFASVLLDAENKYLEGLASTENENYPSGKGYRKMGEYAARVLR